MLETRGMKGEKPGYEDAVEDETLEPLLWLLW